MVMGGDSRTRGRGFESRHRILDGDFLERIEIKRIKQEEKIE